MWRIAMMSVSNKKVSLLAYLYMLIPITIFFLGWVKLPIAVIVSAILWIGFFSLYKTEIAPDHSRLELPVIPVLIAMLGFLVWVILSGQCGLFYQTWDWHGRNAVFRDLINYEWPVIFPETGNALNYYFIFWMVPALVGKLFGWGVASVVLLIWTYVGILLSFLLILRFLSADSGKKVMTVFTVFVIWGGLHIIGLLFTNAIGWNNFSAGGGDGWLDGFCGDAYTYSYQYSSNNTLLDWVFNQTIVPWVAVPLFLNAPKINTFAFIGLCTLPFSPLPFVGFFIILCVWAIPIVIKYIKDGKIKELMQQIFSIPNIAATLSIFPIFLLFFTSNSALSNAEAGGGFGLYVPLEAFGVKRIVLLALFYLIEFGIYAVLIWKDHKRDYYYYMTIAALIVIPLFKVGKGRDFCMRASIPLMFLLMIWVLKFLIDNAKNSKYQMHIIGLVVALTISSFNVISPISGEMRRVRENGGPVLSDDLYTFSDKHIQDPCDTTDLINFIVEDPEDAPFYKYIAR